MIRISLVIPTHNRAAQLVAALESVVRQDLPRDEWECVVVSNNSTDDTEARFAAFAAAHPGCGLRLVAEEGPGVSYARNRGLREAQAPLVAFIDDDERVNEGFLRAYLEFFETRPGAVVAGGRIVAEYPAGRIGKTQENLLEAAEGELLEWSDLYSNFSTIAVDEGFKDVAAAFRAIARVEEFHEWRYRQLLSRMEEHEVFRREEPIKWQCRNCGYIHEGLNPPEKCPACLHPKAYFEPKRNNY